MVSYRLIMFGLGMAAIAMTLMFFNEFIITGINISADVAAGSTADTGRDFFTYIYNGLMWVLLVLASVAVISGVLVDRARRTR